MDCFRSGRDWAAGAEPVVLAGRAGVLEGDEPKKSNPKSESPGLVCLGGAASVFGGGALVEGGPVLGREGGGSSPKMSIVGCFLTGAGAAWLVEAAARCEVERSNLAFSCTTFNG